MAVVHVPPQLRDLTDGATEIRVAPGSLRDVIGELEGRFPGFAGRVTSDGALNPGLAFSIDHVVTSMGLLARVHDESVVHIVPGIPGG